MRTTKKRKVGQLVSAAKAVGKTVAAIIDTQDFEFNNWRGNSPVVVKFTDGTMITFNSCCCHSINKGVTRGAAIASELFTNDELAEWDKA